MVNHQTPPPPLHPCEKLNGFRWFTEVTHSPIWQVTIHGSVTEWHAWHWSRNIIVTILSMLEYVLSHSQANPTNYNVKISRIIYEKSSKLHCLLQRNGTLNSKEFWIVFEWAWEISLSTYATYCLCTLAPIWRLGAVRRCWSVCRRTESIASHENSPGYPNNPTQESKGCHTQG